MKYSHEKLKVLSLTTFLSLALSACNGDKEDSGEFVTPDTKSTLSSGHNSAGNPSNNKLNTEAGAQQNSAAKPAAASDQSQNSNVDEALSDLEKQVSDQEKELANHKKEIETLNNDIDQLQKKVDENNGKQEDQLLQAVTDLAMMKAAMAPAMAMVNSESSADNQVMGPPSPYLEEDCEDVNSATGISASAQELRDIIDAFHAAGFHGPLLEEQQLDELEAQQPAEESAAFVKPTTAQGSTPTIVTIPVTASQTSADASTQQPSIVSTQSPARPIEAMRRTTALWGHRLNSLLSWGSGLLSQPAPASGSLSR